MHRQVLLLLLLLPQLLLLPGRSAAVGERWLPASACMAQRLRC